MVPVRKWEKKNRSNSLSKSCKNVLVVYNMGGLGHFAPWDMVWSGWHVLRYFELYKIFMNNFHTKLI